MQLAPNLTGVVPSGVMIWDVLGAALLVLGTGVQMVMSGLELRESKAPSVAIWVAEDEILKQAAPEDQAQLRKQLTAARDAHVTRDIRWIQWTGGGWVLLFAGCILNLGAVAASKFGNG